MLYGAECWPTKRRHVQQLGVAEMRMLRWMCGHTRKDRVRNDDIRDRVGVAPIEEKLVQHRLRWFGHIQRRPPEAPVHSGRLKRAENVKRGRGRPILTWEESVKRDLKDWSIDKELTIHDFRMVDGPTHTNLIFDIVVPCKFRLTNEELEKQIDSGVKHLLGENYYTIIEVDRAYL